MTTSNSANQNSERKRLAIIGGGSSGLICLKNSLDLLPDWEITCFEQTDQITGCWGNPYPGFVSTSTKYTTQFACFPQFDALCHADHSASRSEFFREGEYGQYLEQFAERFNLRPHIALKLKIEQLNRSEQGTGWNLTITNENENQPQTSIEHFDQVILCTGLASEPKAVNSKIACLSPEDLNRPDGLSSINNKQIIVIGGGESAVDYANRLAHPKLNNQVYLSLKSGIRVSPRYHPIRGVPSDFLRNRLMLSIHEDIRNWIGQRFVQWRIRYQELFEKLFPGSNRNRTKDSNEDAVSHKKKEWAYKLTQTAKDDLFNMFHNKSDDFLDAVAKGRIQIIGESLNEKFTTFYQYDSQELVTLAPDLIVPAIGYRSRIQELTNGEIRLTDFHLGCLHVRHPDLFLVGFARPIIGNIPTISEVQAELICGLIAGNYYRPDNINTRHQTAQQIRQKRYSQLNQETVYPVEMFPYCDQLSRMMNIYPTIRATGSLKTWYRMQLAPASTMHYQTPGQSIPEPSHTAPIYMPPVFILILLLLKPVSWGYGLFCKVSSLRSKS